MKSEFQDLKNTRDRLRERARQHWRSVTSFHDEENSSFKLHVDESAGNFHLTTTATCLESLETCPTHLRTGPTGSEILDTLPTEFAKEAIALDQESWRSDDSAQIYCRCRSLPFVLSNLDDDLLLSHETDIKKHVDHIFRQIELAESTGTSRLSIGEAYVPDRDSFEPSDMTDWYPPNGFHTYWGLNVIDTLAAELEKQYDELKSEYKLEQRRNLMIEWAWQELGTQVGLHEANSSARDSDQLMWTIATIATFDDLTTVGLEEQDLISGAIECLFANQEEVGTWRHQKPLFHYKTSGNAYSHVYEALNAVIKPAIQRELPFFQKELAKYRSHFERLMDYSEATAQTLDDGEVVWRSGHRTNNTKPEGWATANTFSFVQNLRRLIGQWTRASALDRLPTRTHERNPETAAERLLDRGETWCFDNQITVGEKLQKLYLEPLKYIEGCDDPDIIPIPPDQARSAILFGPPGTSKTSMIRAIAEAIGWEYVEIHSSHFVAEGLNNVQKTANEIFQQIGELDRCVVLFDEIDELVRAREEADVYGRFLTTSMLPRIGELWEDRQILYFVATNHIEYFDPAIVRGERFDAAIFVPPPAFEKKVRRVLDLISDEGIDLADDQIDVTREQVQEHFEKIMKKTASEIEDTKTEANTTDWERHLDDKELPVEDFPLASFAILRWDELPELAARLVQTVDNIESGFDGEELGEALTKMQNERLRHAQGYKPFIQRSRERLDYGMKGTIDLTK